MIIKNLINLSLKISSVKEEYLIICFLCTQLEEPVIVGRVKSQSQLLQEIGQVYLHKPPMCTQMENDGIEIAD